MTAAPSGSAPVWVIPADDVGDEEVDVLSLARQPVPDGGAWLWVTSAESQPDGELAGLFLPGNRPAACGGDVLVQLGLAGEPDVTAKARVQVCAPWIRDLRGLPATLERLRIDRQLEEALACDADPLHLAAVFGMNTSTAIRYAVNARHLREHGHAARLSASPSAQVPGPGNAGGEYLGSP